MIFTHFFKKGSAMLGQVSATSWVWVVVSISFLLTAAITTFTVRQREITNQFSEEIAFLRQSRIDLIKGYLYVSLANSAASPFDHDQGLALFDQAQLSLDRALQLHHQNFGDSTDNLDQFSVEGFKREVEAFRKILVEAQEVPGSDPAVETRIRIAFYALEKHAGEVDRQLQVDLNSLHLRNTRLYASFLGGAGLLLIVLCLAVYAGARARQQVERELFESEKRFREMLEGVQLVALILDEGGRIEFCNDYLLQLVGFSREELIGQNWFERFIQTGQTQAKEIFDQSLVSGHIPARFENPIVTRGGEQRLIAFNNFILKDRTGKITGIASLGIDITERRLADDALRRSNERLQVVFDSIPVMITLLGPDLKHEYVNQYWQKTLGWSLEDVQNKDMLEVLYPDPEIRRQVTVFIQAKSGTWADFETQTRDGRVLSTSWINVPLADGTNIGIGINMTERKQSEVRMREQNDELRRWHAITLGREERIQELKQEINQLLAQIGQPGRYDSVKSDRSTRQGSGQPADDRPLSDADAGETR